MMDVQEHASKIREDIAVAVSEGYTVEVQSKGFPDPTEERLVIFQETASVEPVWHWKYED